MEALGRCNPRGYSPRGLVTALLFLLTAGLSSGVAQAPPTLKIYLARHGQTDWNRDHRLQGGTDVPLNATGRRQASDLAEEVKDIHFEAIYSSGLKRSQETAEIVGGSAGPISLADLNERRLGTFEGRQNDGAHPQLALEYERRLQDPNDTLDGGESLNQFCERVRTTLRRILAQHQSGAILIVGHGGTNQMIARALLSLSVEEARAFQQDNDELYLFVVDHETARRVWKLVNVKSRPSIR